MQWKEVLTVSVPMGLLVFVLTIAEDINLLGLGHLNWESLNIIGVLTTGLILNRKLRNKEEWGILIGMIITLVIPGILNSVLSLIVS